MKRRCSMCNKWFNKQNVTIHCRNKTKNGERVYYRCKVCNRNHMRKYYSTKAGKKKMQELNKKSYYKYHLKGKARSLLNINVWLGKIQKPSACSICKKKSKIIDGHHENYKKPLEVIWVCRQCHAKIEDRKFAPELL